MPNDFQEPLNLKEKNSQPVSRNFGVPKQAPNPGNNNLDRPKPIIKNNPSIEKIYQEHGGNAQEMRKFTKPSPAGRFRLHLKWNEKTKKTSIIIITAIVVLSGLVWLFMNYQANKKQGMAPKLNWYAVKLIDGEIFYGQIGNTSADPIVMEKVYYNYNQAKDKNKETSANSNLILVKRGKEAHGPSGTMEIVRAQIVYMEPMQESSKVLQAILEYEK